MVGNLVGRGLVPDGLGGLEGEWVAVGSVGLELVSGWLLGTHGCEFEMYINKFESMDSSKCSSRPGSSQVKRVQLPPQEGELEEYM